jgi:hypothetical protein
MKKDFLKTKENLEEGKGLSVAQALDIIQIVRNCEISMYLAKEFAAALWLLKKAETRLKPKYNHISDCILDQHCNGQEAENLSPEEFRILINNPEHAQINGTQSVLAFICKARDYWYENVHEVAGMLHLIADCEKKLSIFNRAIQDEMRQWLVSEIKSGEQKPEPTKLSSLKESEIAALLNRGIDFFDGIGDAPVRYQDALYQKMRHVEIMETSPTPIDFSGRKFGTYYLGAVFSVNTVNNDSYYNCITKREKGTVDYYDTDVDYDITEPLFEILVEKD